MVEMEAVYTGCLRCTAKHLPSGSSITTDAPKDNQGRGEAFSPTDLAAAALGTCVLTIAGIYAQRHNLDLSGATARISKEMAAAPLRRIARITVKIKLPARVPPEHRKALESAAHACPVGHSLHPDVQQVVEFSYE